MHTEGRDFSRLEEISPCCAATAQDVSDPLAMIHGYWSEWKRRVLGKIDLRWDQLHILIALGTTSNSRFVLRMEVMQAYLKVHQLKRQISRRQNSRLIMDAMSETEHLLMRTMHECACYDASKYGGLA